MEEFIATLRNTVPECFELSFTEVSFETAEEFQETAEDGILFRALAEKITGVECAGVYVDRYESGFLGAYALALWFMEFDEDNWFPFEEIHIRANTYLNSRARLKDRIELHLLKGKFSPMMLDQPVLVDFRDKTICFLSVRLNN